MNLELTGLVLLGLLLVFLAGGLWVGLALTAVASVGIVLFTPAPLGPVMSQTYWSAVSGWSLAPLPLFIWMGEILFRTRLSEQIFAGLAPWLERVPGRLLHVNVIGSALFAGVSGSSAATAATLGRMSIPELRRRGYPDRLIFGSLAGSGTLGLLIPPSIMLIIYGVSAEVSIARLFIAGLLPGLMLVALFMGYLVVWALLHPHSLPSAPQQVALGERLYASAKLLPLFALIIGVIGSIYTGIATPTESAALGVVGALLIAALSKSLNWGNFRDSLAGAARTTAMIGFILAGSTLLTKTMAYTGIPTAMATAISSLHLSTYALLAVLLVVFILMGMFLDGISMIVLTSAILLPMIQAAHIDLLWFGIFVVIVVEMAQITPPVGFNLFVLQGLSGRDSLKIARDALAFFLVMIVAVVLLVVFPQIAIWLPAHMLH
ncbi:TRAP transporter large permease [Acidihalobacter ferrooxydans]|uniref:TRAP transporter large permease protein n=1 Tax=Acidihalobacter ferrooxydans TaxID=1765967 RepID=A0A1P8UG74_9GAMM|nr:TRAP transporter large permease subunit [Acidihalobacter ferrooxydans]APZ42815.1 C4-dicarboxylate ABC transporter permease [Acidihalobacter ferrooxydans]